MALPLHLVVAKIAPSTRQDASLCAVSDKKKKNDFCSAQCNSYQLNIRIAPKTLRGTGIPCSIPVKITLISNNMNIHYSNPSEYGICLLVNGFLRHIINLPSFSASYGVLKFPLESPRLAVMLL